MTKLNNTKNIIAILVALSMFGCRISVKTSNSGGDAGNTPAPSVPTPTPAPSVPQPHHLYEPSTTAFVINGQSWPLQVQIQDQSNNVVPVSHTIEISAYANGSCSGPKQGQLTLGSTTSDTITVNTVNGVINLASIIYTDNTNGRVWLSLKDNTDSSVTGICRELAIQEPSAQQLVFVNVHSVYTSNPWPAFQVEVRDSANTLVGSSKAPVRLKAYSNSICTTEITSGFNPGGDPILAVGGIATFNNVSDTMPVMFYIKATSPGLISTTCHKVSKFISISSGGSHTCGITNDGALYCWGSNGFGRLGNGTTINSNIPVPVSGMSSNVTAVSAGSMHTCAVQNGTLYCWGNNSNGRLGDGSTTNRTTPVPVIGMSSNVTAVAAGGNHTCAIQSGALKCWGRNTEGQLGNGTTTSYSTPQSVGGMGSNVTAVVGGFNHTCAIQSGALKCWGYNSNGQLGDGTTTNRTIPVFVIGMSSNVTAVAAGGYHTCAIQSGGLKCWGRNSEGQLGNGTLISNSTPQSLSSMSSNITAVTGGLYHTCAIQSGALKCWGWNSSGQIGNGTVTNSPTPQSVISMSSNTTIVAGGSNHTCAIQSGALKCWGFNSNGELGNGSLINSSTPVLVSPVP